MPKVEKWICDICDDLEEPCIFISQKGMESIPPACTWATGIESEWRKKEAGTGSMIKYLYAVINNSMTHTEKQDNLNKVLLENKVSISDVMNIETQDNWIKIWYRE